MDLSEPGKLLMMGLLGEGELLNSFLHHGNACATVWGPSTSVWLWSKHGSLKVSFGDVLKENELYNGNKNIHGRLYERRLWKSEGCFTDELKNKILKPGECLAVM